MEAKAEFAQCQDCTLQTEPYVPSVGPERAKVVLCGEAPGRQEVRQGEPFVGPAGQLLDLVLQEYNLKREDCFITNAVLCRPPQNRVPSKLEVKCCSKRLEHEVSRREPEHILTLGNTGATAIFDQPVKITSFRAGPSKTADKYPGAKVTPTFHPAACLRAADNFPSMVKDFAKALSPVVMPKWEPPKYVVFSEPNHAIRGLQELLRRTTHVVVDIETAAPDKDTDTGHPDSSHLLCVGLGYDKGKVAVLAQEALASNPVRYLLQEVLETKKIIAHNGKFDLQGLRAIAPKGKQYFDTMLASYVLDERPGIHGLKFLAREVLGAPAYDLELKKYKNFGDVPDETLHRYNAYDCSCTWDLYAYYDSTFSDSDRRLHAFLVDASNELVDLESDGIKVDQEYLEDLRGDLESGLENKEIMLNRWVENPRSPKQVKEAILELGKLVKSTDAATLSTLQSSTGDDELRELCSLMLDYRSKHKTYSTYVKGIKKRMVDGKIYPSFRLHRTVTGRLSSANPNMQNMTRGSVVRSIFVPEPGNVFLQTDYRAIELRVVACLSKDPYLQSVFNDPLRDIHSEVALTLGIPRQKAKVVVYGLSYGMEAKALSGHINVPIYQAQKYLNQFFEVIPNVIAWREEIRRQLLEEHTDLETPYGRKRRFWLITADNREDIVKEGTAFKPQSIASDINLDAMIQLRRQGVKVKVPVHDSLLIECPEEDVEDVKKITEEAMLEAGARYDDFVRFDVESKVGSSWGEV